MDDDGRRDPTPADALTGLEQLRQLVPLARDLPNIGRLLGIEPISLEHGSVTLTLITAPDFANPLGMVHGGICATLLDSVMGSAVHSTLLAGQSYSTLELKVNYTAAVSVHGQLLTATGTTVHVGRSTATAQGTVHDESGRLVAHGTTTCLVHRPRTDRRRPAPAADGRPDR